VRRINESGYLAILITNQSAIARGLLSEEQLAVIHRDLLNRLARNGCRLDAIYYCPHHPTEGNGTHTLECDCRKPKPGLLIKAATDFELDLNHCVIIGDTLKDIAAGHRAGCLGVLVRTGCGAEIAASLRQGPQAPGTEWYPDYTASDILQAVDWSLERIGERSSS
jgi:D-glycero-D-manno-heptose 1,7-bisphosphate phosphatase